MADLRLRPHIEHDDAAFGVYIRGAQNVSRAYQNIYNLDSIRHEVARVRDGDLAEPKKNAALERLASQRQAVLMEMTKFDAEVLNFTRFDPSWNKAQQNFALSDDPDVNLATGLRISGKLMTSGALVILHRTTAFGNARIFLEPQCGIPGAQALEDNFDSFFNIDVIPGGASNSASPSTSLSHSTNRKVDALWHRRQEKIEGQEEHSSDDEGEENPPADLPEAQIKPENIPVWRPKLPGSSGGLGCATPDDLSQPLAPAPTSSALTIGEEGDRFADGPYDPLLSFERCRFAAYTMWTTLGHVLKHLNPDSGGGESWTEEEESTAPLLPPLSCCSYVLGAYAMLMQCLYVQLYGQDPRTANVLRGRAWQIEKALQRFVRHWGTLQDYRTEVATLLVANQSLVESKDSANGEMALRATNVPFQQQAPAQPAQQQQQMPQQQQQQQHLQPVA